ncbi:OmpA family protein [Moraxella cuniculi]|uniref:Outer membrane protein II n=1 Tax=Moraxella cuniculi TaxID=34061 RepID=A0A448GVE3_9GAMM|nr:OmpA family protein [Moraxella cuniculi]VEG12746.1 Outer membrane protein II* [Moraxella cuniculi]
MKKMKLLTACCILATLGSTAQARDVIHRWCPPEEAKPVEVVPPVVVEQPVIIPEPVPVQPERPVPPPVRQIEIAADALFRFDKSGMADMLPEGKARLDELARVLNEEFIEISGIALTGHTDRLGSESYNLALGQRRADTVKAYLQQKGILVPISATSAGESQPVVQCSDSLGREALKNCLQPNRRVTVDVSGYAK